MTTRNPQSHTQYSPNDHHISFGHRRNPETTQAWLIGGGIASLATAVFLIKDVGVPASNIHIFDPHSHPGGGIGEAGNAESGYILSGGHHISYHDACIQKLLSSVPCDRTGSKSLWDNIVSRRSQQDHHERPVNRLFVGGSSGPVPLKAENLGLDFHNRMELIKLLLEREDMLNDKSIADTFPVDFFSTKFWKTWSTTFVFTPSHGVVEFRRSLRKFLHDVAKQDRSTRIDRLQYSHFESIIVPIVKYLVSAGVDFRLNEKVVDVNFAHDREPSTISNIKYQTSEGTESTIPVLPIDVVFMTLGSVGAMTVLGTNTSAPPLLNMPLESDWSLWLKLAERDARFGNPGELYNSRSDSTVEMFTVTMKDKQFFDDISALTHHTHGSQPVLSFPDSSWLLSIDIPDQPVVHGQPEGVSVFSGWAMYPERVGNFVKKPMLACTGVEILEELLLHFQFPLKPTINNAITIPSVLPLATAPLLPRIHGDRPAVIPTNTANLALLGQFVELPEEATLSMEYSIRSAMVGVYKLMGLRAEPPKPSRNFVVEFLDLFT